MKFFDHVTGLNPIEMSTTMIDGRRYYLTPTGNKYKSVTTVISNNPEKKAGIQRWRNRVGAEEANRISAYSTGRGNKYHKLVENFINNEHDTELYKEDTLVWDMFNASLEVLNNINNVYFQEAALYSDVLGLAGRVDCIAEYNGKLSIIDFKTSKKYKKKEYLYDYYVQEVAYACMLLEQYNLKIEQLVTIVAVESGMPQVEIVPPKKEYLIRLEEYIKEYEQTYEGSIRG
jgi:CRISPR/Cas system-associated exonuclease Cas4 (RecB family)